MHQQQELRCLLHEKSGASDRYANKARRVTEGFEDRELVSQPPLRSDCIGHEIDAYVPVATCLSIRARPLVCVADGDAVGDNRKRLQSFRQFGWAADSGNLLPAYLAYARTTLILSALV